MQLRPTRLTLAIASSLIFSSGAAQASGFALIEQNASGLGNAYAGQAASAQDSSTVFFNPAGLTEIAGTQVVFAGNLISPSAKFTDSGSVAASLQSTLGSNGGDAGGLALAPNFYYAQDLGKNLKFGLGISAPFGLATEYDDAWVGRFQAVKSEVQTININPSLAFKANETVSLGAGLDIALIKATLTKMTNYSAAIYAATGSTAYPNLSGLSSMEGDDWAYGFNLGALIKPAPGTRIGLSYRSRLKATLEGDVTFSNVPAPLAAALPNGPIIAKVTLPDSFSASVFKKINDRFDFLADASWTNWSLFKELKVDRTTGTNVSTTPENWEDTWRYSIGLNYHPNANTIWRAGIAYDQSPVPEAFRTPRIPDQDRTWLAIGMQHTLSNKSKLDWGYAHLFVKDAAINSTVAGQGTLAGVYNSSVDILSIQYTLNL